MADPEPCDFVVLQYADGPVGERDADRVDGLAVMYSLELQARVLSVLLEQTAGLEL